jgi:hypothetical protein
METIETKSGKLLEISPRGIRKSVRHAHALIKKGLPGAEPGPYRYDTKSGCIVERATGKVVGKLNRD